jgi:DNA-binding winged helix-turn-helix (wHTH) protein
VAFGAYVLDADSRELLRGAEPVHLSRKAMDTLLFLVARRPQVVTKQALFDRVWPNCFVSDATLASVVAELRRALQESGRQAAYLRTVHGVGYKFSADVREIEAASPVPPATCWLVFSQHEHPLTDGEYILGRCEPARIVLLSRGVSRQHARVVVTRGTAMLEDLGSKNGTFLNGRRITSPQPLEDGDQIGVGRFTLIFRAVDGTTATGTAIGEHEPPRS